MDRSSEPNTATSQVTILRLFLVAAILCSGTITVASIALVVVSCFQPRLDSEVLLRLTWTIQMSCLPFIFLVVGTLYGVRQIDRRMHIGTGTGKRNEPERGDSVFVTAFVGAMIAGGICWLFFPTPHV